MDKLIFEVVKPKVSKKDTEIMRVSRELYNVLNRISNETGLPMVRVTARIAEYLADKVEFIDKKEA